MKFDVKIDVSDIDDLFADMQRGLQNTDDTTAKFCADVVRSAKIRVPHDTGFLKWSIRYHKTKKGAYTIEAGALYAGHVEYGTSKMRAQPYLNPAINAMYQKYITALEKDIAGK